MTAPFYLDKRAAKLRLEDADEAPTRKVPRFDSVKNDESPESRLTRRGYRPFHLPMGARMGNDGATRSVAKAQFKPCGICGHLRHLKHFPNHEVAKCADCTERPPESNRSGTRAAATGLPVEPWWRQVWRMLIGSG